MIVNHLLVQMGQCHGGWCVVLCLQHSAQRGGQGQSSRVWESKEHYYGHEQALCCEQDIVWQSLRKWPPDSHLWQMLVIFLLPATSFSIAAPEGPILVHTGPDRPPWPLLVTRMWSRDSLSDPTVLRQWALEFFLDHSCVWHHVAGGCLHILDDKGLDASLSAHFPDMNWIRHLWIARHQRLSSKWVYIVSKSFEMECDTCLKCFLYLL